MVKFGASIYSISRKIISNEITPAQGVQWLAEHGAEVIEIVPFGIDILNNEISKSLISESQKTGVQLDNYSLNANFLQLSESEYQTEMDRVKSHIDAAAILGVSTMRVDCASFRRPIETNTIENFQIELPLIIETYQTLCDYAKQYNLKILLENHGFHVNGSDRVRQIMHGVNRSNFSHLLDTGNYVCVDDIAELSVKKMVEFASVIHMKDFYIRSADPGDATQFNCSGTWFRSVNGRYLRGSILAQGDLNIYEILKTIKYANFSGNIFVEFEGMEDCYYGTQVSLNNLKRIYNEV